MARQKKVSIPIVQCIDCANAEIHQRNKNPYICFCFGNPDKRYVASTPIRCASFSKRATAITDNEIIHSYD